MSVEPRFFNRELSWLEFNQRVLDEASDRSIPLLERLKFLAITASNLDEFTMVRVGNLQLLHAEGDLRPDPLGLTTPQQLKAIKERMDAFLTEQYCCLLSELEPALAQAGMRRLKSAELNDRQVQHVQLYFEQEVFPILTPLAVFSSTPTRTESGKTTETDSSPTRGKGLKRKSASLKATSVAMDESTTTSNVESLAFPLGRSQ